MVKIVVYEPDYNEKHRIILRALAEGLPNAEVRSASSYIPCDIAVVFGGVSKRFPQTWNKKIIFERHKGRSLLMVESAFIRRGVYYQVGWGGVAGFADFNVNDKTPLDRWMSIASDRVKPWQVREDSPVVVCGQIPHDVQVQDEDHVSWCRNTVDYYDKLKIPVLFRPHPKIADVGIYKVPSKFVDTRPLSEALAIAKVFVTWNSTSSVDAIIHGVPAIALHKSSIAWPVTSHNLDMLGVTVPRETWFAGLGYSQWTLAEMKAGMPWSHLKAKGQP